MPKALNQPLTVNVNPSRNLCRLMYLAHALALAACLTADLSLVIKASLIIALALNYLQTAIFLRHSRLRLTYSQATGWRIAENEDFLPVTILPSSVLTGRILFLHLEISQTAATSPTIAERLGFYRRKSVVIMSDALSTDDFRRLIVKVKTTWRETTRAIA